MSFQNTNRGLQNVSVAACLLYVIKMEKVSKARQKFLDYWKMYPKYFTASDTNYQYLNITPRDIYSNLIYRKELGKACDTQNLWSEILVLQGSTLGVVLLHIFVWVCLIRNIDTPSCAEDNSSHANKK